MKKHGRFGTRLYSISKLAGHFLVVVAVAATVNAQSKDDVGTIDGIIKAYYEVISGPAGEAPDFERDASLHHSTALISIASVSEQGGARLSTMSLKGYYDRFGGPRESGFYEWEIHRRTERFGNIANVWSTYAASEKPNGEPFARGINNIQLFYDGERWWIISWIYDTERRGNAIPEDYLPKKSVD
ncbi:MAG: hypothetical protein DWQ47_06375 [Acidobacteria bacterium]|nr:MAG: hypothetical protein DWQ32_09925 [Acidobacteriota bacterium]REK01999.1 MAG: hypothetical protein DWQ38_06355 [Acidobacteriota bacterium]REK14957.1 MAG: hypothetical protein DWQ43_15615 [Acidobacteriota bacterium]REK45671.1 MAG: hypothetical protein DWQ47_06375 [Acidobacteriota bacterium]